ncbi:MAG TPA: class I SAM-dependent methyltransferase [Pseudomonadales bacterium]|nr:class I SAM-dependent methyltransferase [Pseudomonadales bacterium]
MSDEDRRRWNERYGAGAYQSREHPSSVLLDWKDALTGNSVLDLACGRGRNAIHLATLGFEVDAIDISDMAIQQATRRADSLGVHVHWLAHDLERGVPLVGPYDLILMIRYVDNTLLSTAVKLLAPRGKILVEEHLVSNEAVIGPTNPEFRVQPGSVQQTLRGLEIEREFEGLIQEPDGTWAALVRVLAQRA